MKARNFVELLRERWVNADTLVCVGLDSDYNKIPKSIRIGSVKDTIQLFNKIIVDETADLVCAFKPNIAFYEKHGPGGMNALIHTVKYINETYPAVPVILDAKRADIGHTNSGYIIAAFEWYGVDAITVNPYLGSEALKPFLSRSDKGIIVLCRTSNPGAGEFQDLLVDGHPLYQVVAKQVANSWNQNGNCALVMGATYPGELAEVRKLVGDLPLLIPGIGAQGGDVEATVKAGLDSHGVGMMINSSRKIIYASDDQGRFWKAVRNKALALRDEINTYR